MFAHSFRLEVATFWRHSMSLYAFAFPPQHIATIAIVPEMLSRLFWRGGGLPNRSRKAQWQFAAMDYVSMSVRTSGYAVR